MVVIVPSNPKDFRPSVSVFLTTVSVIERKGMETVLVHESARMCMVWHIIGYVYKYACNSVIQNTYH